ncbi:MAG: GDYXXLXY domain-containing protein [Colwellia sp.]|nr:GDYXXLXY domain-containing protein [Colwellia sp.]
MQKTIAVMALVFILLVVNFSIYKKEALIENGQLVFLKLAPVDPRSIMQGDYMALRFAMESEIITALKAKELVAIDSHYYDSMDGLVNVHLDAKNVATFVNVDSDSLMKEAQVLQFRLRKGRIKFATNAFFFEEGSRKIFEGAQYGEFRVGNGGELLLVGLRDKNLEKLG